MTMSTLRRPRPTLAARWSALSRTVGTAFGSALALALLTCGCVFAALAGPALSLHTRTQALHQTLASTPNTTKTVQVSANLANFTGAMQVAGSASPARAWPAARSPSRPGTSPQPGVDAAPARGRRLGRAEHQPAPHQASAARQRLCRGAAPDGGGLPRPVQRLRAAGGRLVFERAGSARRGGRGRHQADGRAVRAASRQPPDADHQIRPGHPLRHRHHRGAGRRLHLLAAGHDHRAAVARAATINSPPYWVGGVIAVPGQLAAIQSVFGGIGLEMQWEFPLDVSRVNADQAQGLYQALNRAATSTPTLSERSRPARTRWRSPRRCCRTWRSSSAPSRPSRRCCCSCSSA